MLKLKLRILREKVNLEPQETQQMERKTFIVSKNSLKNKGRNKLENSQENHGLRFKLKPLYVQPASRFSKMLKYHDNS